MKNQFKSNSSKINEKIDQMLKNQKWTINEGEEKSETAKVIGIKEVIGDTLAVWGKCFLVGCTVVSAFRLIKDAMKADEEFSKKYGVI